jgi:predicted RNase H-like nuclease (RuvC/YqgF family)
MVEDLVLVAVALMAVVLGYSLGLAHLKESEKEQKLQSKSLAQKVQMYQALVKQLESKLARAEAQDLILQSELDLAQVRVQDSELELVRVKAQLERAELALEELRYRNQETDWKGHH